MEKTPQQDPGARPNDPAPIGGALLNKFPNLSIGVLLVLVLALATWQGARVRATRDAEGFYRWILAEDIRARVFGDETEALDDPDAKKMVDRDLFRAVANAAAAELAGVVTITADDVDQQGRPLSRLSVLIRDAAEDRDGVQDWRVWALASGPVLAKEREDFFRYSREKRLASVASEFDPETVYGEAGANVSIGNVFFGFRKIAANFVWLEVDRYWHQGMMHRMLPLMKTCVTLDPHFVDAFLLGSWHLAYNQTAKMLDTPEPLKEWHPKYRVRLGEKERYYYLAVDFLKDGIRKNPRNYKLYFDLGFGIYRQKLSDYANAVLYLSEAIRHRHDKWVPRQLYQCLELNEQYEESLAGWQDYLAKNPENLVAPRFILRVRGRILERDAERALERAREASDPLEAQLHREESKQFYAEARAVYEEMAEPFATGRILRMDALGYIDKGQYLEAIAVLDHARWESNEVWQEACDLIIETKLKAGVPLSQSEKMAVQRKKDAEKYATMPPPGEQEVQ